MKVHRASERTVKVGNRADKAWAHREAEWAHWHLDAASER